MANVSVEADLCRCLFLFRAASSGRPRAGGAQWLLRGLPGLRPEIGQLDHTVQPTARTVQLPAGKVIRAPTHHFFFPNPWAMARFSFWRSTRKESRPATPRLSI